MAPGIPGQIGVEDGGRVMDTNFTSTVLANQTAAAVMGEAGGRIINFGSSEGVMGSPRFITGQLIAVDGGLMMLGA